MIKTYYIEIDGFRFISELTPAEAALMATDDSIIIKEV